MTLNDTLANALAIILNGERIGKKEVEIKPVSKIIEQVLKILNEQGYVGTYKKQKAIGGERITLQLLGNVNQCGSIKPRLAIPFTRIERFEKRHLPARNVGILLISTSQGIITNEEARKKRVGGRLLAYCS